MPSAHLLRSVPVERTPRVLQLEGLFDLPPTLRSELTWEVDLPLDERPWHLGLIVGPSGSGKTTILRDLLGWTPGVLWWPPDEAVVDAFPDRMGIKEVTGLLSSVGFSSPPAWLRPFHALSNGEQFRVTLARVLAEAQPGRPAVVDEFTSVVDRTVAQIGSAAVAKWARRAGRQLIAASCHYDIVDWLQPDWLYDTGPGQFTWRSLQRRPAIRLEVYRTTTAAWPRFAHHHYLSRDLHPAAKCYVALVDSQPAAFAAVLAFPHSRRPGWRGHRTVCLPDYQGVGIGNALSELVAASFVTTGRPYFSTTGNPAMIHHRARSPLWRLTRLPSRSATGKGSKAATFAPTVATDRLTASFEYVGPPAAEPLDIS